MEIVRLAVPVENNFRKVMRVPKNKLLECIQKYPTLKVLNPTKEGRDVVIRNITPDALLCLIKFASEDAVELSSCKIALETYYTALLYQIEPLQRICEEFISENPITLDNVNEIHQLAKTLELDQVLKVADLYKKRFSESSKLSTVNTAEPMVGYCFMKKNVFLNPFYLSFQLKQVECTDLNDEFPCHLKNEIVVDANENLRVLGIRIRLQPSEFHGNKTLKICCNMSTDCEDSVHLEETRCKSLEPIIIICFREEFLVPLGQKGTISITIEDVKPVMCYGIETESFCTKTGINFTYRSNWKTSQSDLKRVFIDGLFYDFTDNN
ncbi:uncharacterized protein LOC118201780 isoform X1 [Stegodyphus dumicola]|uniref:uncharacterized protein LOC118201780 isoform X1 n=1 Tax=Stegodyphus dumicola TaxID=202533 RepID=UPI0015AEAED6|nr:uncharacterized protein LOC118201780 isoform X1 [Stegodyphus dumicola]